MSSSRRVVVATGYDLILRHLAGALAAAGHEVVGVLTVSAAPPVVAAAAGLGCPSFAVPLMPGEMNIARGMRTNPAYDASVRASVEGLDALEADFLVGWAINVLPEDIFGSARHAINVHPSDLPRYRGGFPLEAQILDGQRALYVTVHETARRIDAGAVLTRSEALKIKRSDTMTSLLNRALPVGARLAAGTVTHYGALPPVPPTHVEAEVPHAWGMKRVRSADGRVSNTGVLGRLRIEWALDTAEDISRAARAFDMIGGAFTDVDGRMFRITRSRAVRRGGSAPPGEVLARDGAALEVQALDAVVQLEGRFHEGAGTVEPGQRFVSTTPISKLLQFEGAER
ncbi:MAG: formyltransferase family protein [Myxococcota bacterium]